MKRRGVPGCVLEATRRRMPLVNLNPAEPRGGRSCKSLGRVLQGPH